MHALARAAWWALFLGHAALIYRLSDGPLPETVAPLVWPGADKLYHAAQYGLLALFGLQAWKPRARAAWLGVLLACWCYGLADEWHQSWVPGREADGLDWLADGAGVVVTGALWRAWQRFSSRSPGRRRWGSSSGRPRGRR